jgi:hypothetical protein
MRELIARDTHISGLLQVPGQLRQPRTVRVTFRTVELNEGAYTPDNQTRIIPEAKRPPIEAALRIS